MQVRVGVMCRLCSIHTHTLTHIVNFKRKFQNLLQAYLRVCVLEEVFLLSPQHFSAFTQVFNELFQTTFFFVHLLLQTFVKYLQDFD